MTAPIRVLHVDDDARARQARAALLREYDHIEVLTAGSASAGLDTLAESDVDCVLSDLEMPGTDGIEFLEAVHERRPEFPFVLLTSRRSPETISRALDAGVSDYVFKQDCTESYDLLVNRIETVVDHYRVRRELGE